MVHLVQAQLGSKKNKSAPAISLNGAAPENNSSHIISVPGSNQSAMTGVVGGTAAETDMLSKGGHINSQVDNGRSDDDDDDDSRSAGVVVDPARGHVLSFPPCGRSLPGNTGGGGGVAGLQLQLVRLPTGKGTVTVTVPVGFSLVRRINCLRGQPEDWQPPRVASCCRYDVSTNGQACCTRAESLLI